MKTCPDCNVEMSKKWHTSGAKAAGGLAMVWTCSVCGCQLTKAEMKLPAKQSAEALCSAPTKHRVESDDELTTITIWNGERNVLKNSEDY